MVKKKKYKIEEVQIEKNTPLDVRANYAKR